MLQKQKKKQKTNKQQQKITMLQKSNGTAKFFIYL